MSLGGASSDSFHIVELPNRIRLSSPLPAGQSSAIPSITTVEVPSLMTFQEAVPPFTSNPPRSSRLQGSWVGTAAGTGVSVVVGVAVGTGV